jgi:hypothetical protein
VIIDPDPDPIVRDGEQLVLPHGQFDRTFGNDAEPLGGESGNGRRPHM